MILGGGFYELSWIRGAFPLSILRSLEAVFQSGLGVVTVELSDDGCWDFSGADGFAFEIIRAVSETLGVHLFDHGQDAAFAFWLSLRE